MTVGSSDEELTADAVSVVTSCDSGYLPYIAAMARSLDVARSPSTTVRLSVLHSGVGAVDRRRVAAGAPGVVLHWVEIEDAAYEAAGLIPEPLVCRPYYFRCLIGTVLPATQRRCIYLDGDTIVRRDLRELWTADLDGAAVGAALDYFLARAGDAIAPWRTLRLDPEASYFNSGVMLVDLNAWREQDIGGQAVRTCLANRDHLMAQGRWPQHDQFGLNVVLHRRWHRLSQDWNYLSEMEFREPNVVHYCGGGKPWSPTCQREFSAWFHEAVDGTAWRGFRGPS